jgi:dihydroorotase
MAKASNVKQSTAAAKTRRVPTTPVRGPASAASVARSAHKAGQASLVQAPEYLFTGVRVIDPVSGTDGIMDVGVAGGKVVAIEKRLARTGVRKSNILDGRAGDLILTPGLIDPHVHLREPGFEHKEDIASGGAAAIAGGFTTVCCMPNTSPALDTPETLYYVQGRATAAAIARFGGGMCRVFPVAAATKGRRGEELAEIELLRSAGAVGYSDDGDGISTAGMMSRVLSAVAPTGLAFMQHCQDPTLTRGSAMHAGEVSVRLGLGGWPRLAEELMIERDIRINSGIGCRYHVQHISSAGSVDLVRKARANGQPVTAEASPHHLLLTHAACEGYNTNAKVNPPLREERDITALREGIADGTITILATDHAPHSADEKQLPFEDAPFGLIGLETALPLYIQALIDTKVIDWPRLIAMLTIEPARLCNLDRLGLGRLSVGGPADITLIDPAQSWKISARDIVSKSHNTPFLGRKVKGRAVAVMVAGIMQRPQTAEI